MTSPRLDRIEQNLLINGAFDFAQRAPLTAVALTTSFVYLSDRWMFQKLGTWTSVPSWERYSTDKPSSKSKYSCRLASMQATDATATAHIKQRIESIFSKFVAGSKVSLTLMYKGSTGSNFTEIKTTLATPTVIDNHASMNADLYSVTKAITCDNTWRPLVFENITIDSSAALGLALNLQLLTPAAPFATTFTFLLGEIKLSVGTKAQEFSLSGRDLEDEISLCRRTYEKSNDLDIHPTTAQGANTVALPRLNSLSSGAPVGFVPFKTAKRTTPVCTCYSYAGTSGRVSNNSGSDLAASSGATQFEGTHGFTILNSSGGALATTSDAYLCRWVAEIEL